MGLEGLAHLSTEPPYHAGQSKDWVKVKNRNHPAMDRVTETF
jgi:hypothetical protein